MRNNLLSLDYNTNPPPESYKLVDKVHDHQRSPVHRYQPLCCSLSGITCLTREAMSRLPEYILVGDPRYNIICRCPCHDSDIGECRPMMLCGGKKFAVEGPIAAKPSEVSFGEVWKANTLHRPMLLSYQSHHASLLPVTTSSNHAAASSSHANPNNDYRIRASIDSIQLVSPSYESTQMSTEPLRIMAKVHEKRYPVINMNCDVISQRYSFS